EIGLEPALDVRPQYLHCDIARALRVGNGCLVDLRDRCSSYGRAKRTVMILKLPSKGFGNRSPAFTHGKRRQLVLEVRQVACQFRSDHVRPCRQKLAKLDVGWPERCQGLGYPR